MCVVSSKVHVDRLYISGKEGGRGSRQIEATYQNDIIGMGKYKGSHQQHRPILTQVVVMKEKITKEEVLRRAKRRG